MRNNTRAQKKIPCHSLKQPVYVIIKQQNLTRAIIFKYYEQAILDVTKKYILYYFKKSRLEKLRYYKLIILILCQLLSVDAFHRTYCKMTIVLDGVRS